MDCIFCKIANGEIPSKKAYEDERILAFYDLEERELARRCAQGDEEAIRAANELTEENADVVSHIFLTAAKLAKELGLDKGYRIVNNCGEDGGQTVHHLHFHLLGGRSMKWPPG